jgi:ferredoxin
MVGRMLGRLRDKLGGGIRTGLKEAVLGAAHSVRGGTTAAPPDPVPPRPAASPPTPLRPLPPREAAPAPSPPPRVEAPEPVAAAPVLAHEAVPAPAVGEGVAAPVGSPALPAPEPVAAPPVAVLLPVEGVVARDAAAPVVAPEPVPAAAVVAALAEPPAEVPPAEAKPSSLAAAALAAASGKVERKVLHADMGSTDVESYRKRAIAAGRDPALVIGKPGMNRAEDGGAFWDPVDNESARAKAGGRVLTVDQWECISCGTCVEQTDKVFVLPPDGKAAPIAQEGPMDLIQDAIEACPVTCIHWVTPEEARERGLATGME